jgi:AcrR family transcriptional regulator
MSVEKSKRPYRLRKRADAMEATRRRITEAAVELHGTIGPARTTMTAVAERAGVQRQTVYRHFPDEHALLAACSAHYSASKPPPDAARWQAIADPAERLRDGLDELYAWYETTEAMWTNVFRDETLVDAVRAPLAELRGYLDEAARTLAAGWGGRRPMVLAAARHAVDFYTWRSLARDGAVSRAGVVELSSAMVARAAESRDGLTRPASL